MAEIRQALALAIMAKAGATRTFIMDTLDEVELKDVDGD